LKFWPYQGERIFRGKRKEVKPPKDLRSTRRGATSVLLVLVKGKTKVAKGRSLHGTERGVLKYQGKRVEVREMDQELQIR